MMGFFANDAAFIAALLARCLCVAGAGLWRRLLPLPRRRLALGCLGLALALWMVSSWSTAGSAVQFTLTDNPGRWFDTGVDVSGTRSLAIIGPGGEIQFSGQSSTVHTVTSLIFPTGAAGMPFDAGAGSTVTLETPGLYVFWCKIHPYMFGAVIVDDPATPELDLGQRITLFNGITVPTASDVALRLVRTFFLATNPGNWQVYAASAPATWDPSYPPVPVLAGVSGAPVRTRGEAIATLSAQLYTPVDWRACLQAAWEMGARVFLELGPGSALTRITQEELPEACARSIEDFNSLQGIGRWVSGALAG